MDRIAQLNRDARLWSRLRKQGYSKTMAEKMIAHSHRKNTRHVKRKPRKSSGLGWF